MAVSGNNISNGDADKQVQNRLLNAAEALFSKNGFESTSIRDITSQAKCNVAAVNYHFGGKENLYHKVFHRHMRTLRDIRIAAINKVMSQGEGEVALEQLLRAFAMAFIEPLIDESGGHRLMELMIHEMLDPHLPKGMFADEVAIPTLNVFGKAIAKICPGLGQKETVASIISVIGQLIHAIHLNEMFSTKDDIRLPVPNFSEMVDHIIAFSAAGIRAAAKGKRQSQ